MNNFFSHESISKVVSINLMWIFFHQFFQTNFSWLIFVQSEFSYKNKIKYSMLLYSNYTYKCLFLFLFLFSILDFVDIFVSRKSCPFRCLSVCFAIANWYILHVMHSFKPKKNTNYNYHKKTDVHLQHPVLFDVFLVMMCETHVLAYIIWMFIIWSSIRNTISINLVFFKGWSIILRCRLSKHWQWVELAYYQHPPSMDSNQKDWVD